MINLFNKLKKIAGVNAVRLEKIIRYDNYLKFNN